MKNQDIKPSLDKLLQRWELPAQSQEERESLTRQTGIAIRRRPDQADYQKPRSWGIWRWALALGFAAVVVTISISQLEHDSKNPQLAKLSGDSSNATALALWQGVQQLFPSRLATIELNNGDTSLELSNSSLPANAAPLFVQLCEGGQCHRFLTISGQTIAAFGKRFEVMEASDGHVLVVSDQAAWSSARPAELLGDLAIEARLLHARQL